MISKLTDLLNHLRRAQPHRQSAAWHWWQYREPASVRPWRAASSESGEAHHRPSRARTIAGLLGAGTQEKGPTGGGQSGKTNRYATITVVHCQKFLSGRNFCPWCPKLSSSYATPAIKPIVPSRGPLWRPFYDGRHVLHRRVWGTERLRDAFTQSRVERNGHRQHSVYRHPPRLHRLKLRRSVGRQWP
jgi:hypothetical protein